MTAPPRKQQSEESIVQTADNLPHVEICTLHDESAASALAFGDSGNVRSTLLYDLMIAVLRTNGGVVLLDPHGDMADVMRPLEVPIVSSGSNDRATP